MEKYRIMECDGAFKIQSLSTTKWSKWTDLKLNRIYCGMYINTSLFDSIDKVKEALEKHKKQNKENWKIVYQD